MDETVEEELKFLSQAAFNYSQRNPTLSRQLLQQFHLKALEIGEKVIPTTYCSKCFTVYIPGANCQVSTVNTFGKQVHFGKRMQSGKVGERIYYHCKSCKTTTMHALSAKAEDVPETPNPILERAVEKSLSVPIPPKILPKPTKKSKKKKNLEQLLAKKEMDSKKSSLSLDDFLNNL